MGRCACGHDWRIHDAERCRINGCGCRLTRADEPRDRPKKEDDPKVVTFIIPAGYTARVEIVPDGDT